MLLVPTAARRRTADEVIVLQGMVERFRSLRGSADHLSLLRLDREFIVELINCSRNPFLRSIIPLYAMSRRFWLACSGFQSKFNPNQITDFHIVIGEAVIRGDELKAERLTSEFLNHVEAFTRYAGTEFL
jgi:DNA-binding GntR family transcriptional regulator